MKKQLEKGKGTAGASRLGSHPVHVGTSLWDDPISAHLLWTHSCFFHVGAGISEKT